MRSTANFVKAATRTFLTTNKHHTVSRLAATNMRKPAFTPLTFANARAFGGK